MILECVVDIASVVLYNDECVPTSIQRVVRGERIEIQGMEIDGKWITFTQDDTVCRTYREDFEKVE